MIGSLLSQVVLGRGRFRLKFEVSSSWNREEAISFNCQTCWDYSPSDQFHGTGMHLLQLGERVTARNSMGSTARVKVLAHSKSIRIPGAKIRWSRSKSLLLGAKASGYFWNAQVDCSGYTKCAAISHREALCSGGIWHVLLPQKLINQNSITLQKWKYDIWSTDLTSISQNLISGECSQTTITH